MKKLVLIILLFWGGVSYSQDTLHIPREELNEFFLAIDTLRHQDSLKTVLVNKLENQIDNYQTLSKKDSLIIDYKNEEIKLLRDQIHLYDDQLKKSNVWYKRPWVSYIAGITSTVFLIHTLNYTLPM